MGWSELGEITVYCTTWCCDCRRVKRFLDERSIAFREVNIDEAPDAEELVLRVNNGRRKVPTIEVEGRYITCSPFDASRLAEELKIPLNPKKPDSN
jgi:mycoredoxin